MTLARTYSAALVGVEGRLIEVEADTVDGPPAITLIGMPVVAPGVRQTGPLRPRRHSPPSAATSPCACSSLPIKPVRSASASPVHTSITGSGTKTAVKAGAQNLVRPAISSSCAASARDRERGSGVGARTVFKRVDGAGEVQVGRPGSTAGIGFGVARADIRAGGVGTLHDRDVRLAKGGRVALRMRWANSVDEHQPCLDGRGLPLGQGYLGTSRAAGLALIAGAGLVDDHCSLKAESRWIVLTAGDERASIEAHWYLRLDTAVKGCRYRDWNRYVSCGYGRNYPMPWGLGIWALMRVSRLWLRWVVLGCGRAGGRRVVPVTAGSTGRRAGVLGGSAVFALVRSACSQG